MLQVSAGAASQCGCLAYRLAYSCKYIAAIRLHVCETTLTTKISHWHPAAEAPAATAGTAYIAIMPYY